MKQSLNFAIRTAIAGSALISASGHATNGMLMEGYGPISTAMGGASMAFDNGTAAMVNNPATLVWGDNGATLEVALGNLRPDVSADIMLPAGTTMSADSKADSFLMPAAGYIRRSNGLAYGVGVFAQGGMGTEYADDSVMQGARSEVSVGSLLAPLAYQVNPQLNVGGALSFVWGGMDLIMGMPVGDLTNPQAGTFADFAVPSSQKLGTASGTLVQGLGNMALTANDMAVFNFSNNSDYSGEASGSGFGARLGFTYQVSPELTLGGAFQSKTAMADWEGDGSMNIVSSADGSVTSFPGSFTVKDFQMPSVLSFGAAFRMDQWLLAADLNQINWSDSMDSFRMNFTADNGAAADVEMFQNWDDQTVLKLGAAYAYSNELTLRFGANLASNPIPDEYMNPLFPAIVENHYTLGAGYQPGAQHAFNGSIVIVPEVEQTNSQTMATSTHSQTNLQFLYSYRF